MNDHSTTPLALDPRIAAPVPAPPLPPGATTTDDCDCWPRPGVVAPINDVTGINSCDACQGDDGSDLDAALTLAKLVGGVARFYVDDPDDRFPYDTGASDEEEEAWLARRAIAAYTGPQDRRIIAGRTDPWVEIDGHPVDWTPPPPEYADTPAGRVARFLAGIATRGPAILREEILTIAGAATGHQNVILYTADLRAVLDELGQPARAEVHLVQRDNFDGLYLFAHEDQAAAYAALHPGADTGTATVIDRANGERMLTESAADAEGATR